MRVFVDTSALLPLLDRSDRDHTAVVSAFEALAAQGASLVTSSYGLAEAGALAQRRLGRGAFERLGEVARRALEVVWVDEDLHVRAWARAAPSGRRGPSLVDCVAFEVMRDEGLTHAVALDAHFRAQGFTILP